MSLPPLALAAEPIARAHPTPVADDETALQVLTDAELAPGLRKRSPAARALTPRFGSSPTAR